MAADFNIEALLALQPDEGSSLEEAVVLVGRGYDNGVSLIGKEWQQILDWE